MEWLFLLARETSWGQANSPYDFVPYRFGPFSFLAYRDLAKLAEAGVIGQGGEHLRLAPGTPPGLPDAEDAVREVLSRYGRRSSDWLLAYTYREYPFYAILAERSDLLRERPARCLAAPAVYTVGYSGSNLDGFLCNLLLAELAGVVDVRHDPVSRVYGFGAHTLAGHLARLGLEYVPHPELGIPSEERKGATTPADRDAIFRRYRHRLHHALSRAVTNLASLMRGRPVALMCAEREPAECHRAVLADALAAATRLPVRHLYA